MGLFIEYGTSTQYGQKITLSGLSGTATLSNLKENTKYFWRVNRYYEGKSYLTPSGSFTTTQLTVSSKDHSISSMQTVLQIGSTVLPIEYNGEKIVLIEIHSLKGELLTRHTVPITRGINPVLLTSPRILSGVCVCKVFSDSKRIANSVVIL